MPMYHYTESGLKNIWLKNGFVVKQTPYGEAVAIQDVKGLHKLIGTLITQRPKMTGPELRFLRKEMAMSQKAFAAFVGTSEQNVSLWERRGRIPQAVDRLIKLVYLEMISDIPNIQIRSKIEELNARDAETSVAGVRRINLAIDVRRDEWKEAA